ncbi:unnamed protein product [Paramecium sonneborni]|uniref:Uncharacterized protein n=1 Tax=Paramecium sonneborni TaxID=65129 RepID=A0A8S1P5K1_9CILI|nr:unnamed protein product [Paramecium sonneborni]
MMIRQHILQHIINYSYQHCAVFINFLNKTQLLSQMKQFTTKSHLQN